MARLSVLFVLLFMVAACCTVPPPPEIKDPPKKCRAVTYGKARNHAAVGFICCKVPNAEGFLHEHCVQVQRPEEIDSQSRAKPKVHIIQSPQSGSN